MAKLFTTPLKIDISEILNPVPKEYKLVWANIPQKKYSTELNIKLLATTPPKKPTVKKPVKPLVENLSQATAIKKETLDEIRTIKNLSERARKIKKFIKDNNKRKKEINQKINTGYIKNDAQTKIQLQNIEKDIKKAKALLKLMEGGLDQLRKISKLNKTFNDNLRKSVNSFEDRYGIEKLLVKEFKKQFEPLRKSKSLTDEMKDTAKKAMNYHTDFVSKSLHTLGLKKKMTETEKQLNQVIELASIATKNNLEHEAKHLMNLAKSLNTQKNVEKITEVIKAVYEKLIKYTENLKKVFGDIKKTVTGLKNSVMLFTKVFDSFDDALGNLPSKILGFVLNPIGLLLTMVTAAIDKMLKFNDAIVNISRQTGATGAQLNKMNNISTNLYFQYRDMGIKLEDMPEIINSSIDGLGNMDYLSQKNVEVVVQLSKGLGASTQDAGEFVGMMRRMTGEGDRGAENMKNYAIAMSQAKGVPIKSVIGDVANAGDNVYGFMSGMPKKMIEVATEVRRQGMNLEESANLSRNILNIQESMGAEMEASIMTGRNINLNMARQKALQGDIIGAQEEVMNQLGGIEEFNRMDIYQKESISKLTGLSIKQLSKTLAQRKEEEKLQKERLDRQNKMDAAIDKGLNMFEKITKISDRWEVFFQRIGELLADTIMPWVEQTRKYLEVNFGKIEKIVRKFLDKIFKPIFNFFKTVFNDLLLKFSKITKSNGDALTIVSTLLDDLGEYIQDKLIPIMSRLYNNFISPLVDTIINLSKEIINWLKNGGWNKIETTFWAVVNAGKSLFKSISGIFNTLTFGMFNSTDGGPGVAGALEKILNIIQSIAGFIQKHPYIAIGLYLSTRLGIFQDLLMLGAKSLLKMAGRSIWNMVVNFLKKRGITILKPFTDTENTKLMKDYIKKLKEMNKGKELVKDKKGIFSRLFSPIQKAWEKLVNSIKNFFKGGKGVDKGAKSVTQATKKFDPKKVAEVLVSMVIITGVLYLTAKALQSFDSDKVSWKIIIATTAVLITFVVAGLLLAIGVGMVMKAASAYAWGVVAGIAAFAAALYVQSWISKLLTYLLSTGITIFGVNISMTSIFKSFTYAAKLIVENVFGFLRSSALSITEDIVEISSFDAKLLFETAKGVGDLAIALSVFNVESGGSAIGKLVGDAWDKLWGKETIINNLILLKDTGIKLGIVVTAISIVNNSISILSQSLEKINYIISITETSKTINNTLDNLKKLSKHIAKFNFAVDVFVTFVPKIIEKNIETYKGLIKYYNDETQKLKVINNQQTTSSTYPQKDFLLGLVTQFVPGASMLMTGIELFNGLQGNDIIVKINDAKLDMNLDAQASGMDLTKMGVSGLEDVSPDKEPGIKGFIKQMADGMIDTFKGMMPELIVKSILDIVIQTFLTAIPGASVIWGAIQSGLGIDVTGEISRLFTGSVKDATIKSSAKIKIKSKSQILDIYTFKNLIRTTNEESRIEYNKPFNKMLEENKQFYFDIFTYEKKTKIKKVSNNVKFFKKLLGTESNSYEKIMYDLFIGFFDERLFSAKMMQINTTGPTNIKNTAKGGIVNMAKGGIPQEPEPGFYNATKEVGNRLGTDYRWLLNIMNSESRLNPHAANPTSSARGLIQFMNTTARGMGLSSSDDFLKMSAIQQLPYVEKYFSPYRGRLNSMYDVTAAVFLPAFIGRPDEYIGDKFSKANGGIRTIRDYGNKLGHAWVFTDATELGGAPLGSSGTTTSGTGGITNIKKFMFSFIPSSTPSTLGEFGQVQLGTNGPGTAFSDKMQSDFVPKTDIAGLEKGSNATWMNVPSGFISPLKRFIVFSQGGGNPWSGKSYGGSTTYAQAGCGPSSLAMIIGSLRGQFISPDAIGERYASSIRAPGAGSIQGNFPIVLKQEGLLSGPILQNPNKNTMMDYFRSGYVFAGHVKNHFVAWMGASPDGSQWLVGDSGNSSKYKNIIQPWGMSAIGRGMEGGQIPVKVNSKVGDAVINNSIEIIRLDTKEDVRKTDKFNKNSIRILERNKKLIEELKILLTFYNESKFVEVA